MQITNKKFNTNEKKYKQTVAEHPENLANTYGSREETFLFDSYRNSKFF